VQLCTLNARYKFKRDVHGATVICPARYSGRRWQPSSPRPAQRCGVSCSDTCRGSACERVGVGVVCQAVPGAHRAGRRNHRSTRTCCPARRNRAVTGRPSCACSSAATACSTSLLPVGAPAPAAAAAAAPNLRACVGGMCMQGECVSHARDCCNTSNCTHKHTPAQLVPELDARSSSRGAL
jgi:hypothetical protein